MKFTVENTRPSLIKNEYEVKLAPETKDKIKKFVTYGIGVPLGLLAIVKIAQFQTRNIPE